MSRAKSLAGLYARRLDPAQNNPREIAFVEQWDREHEDSDLLSLLFSIEDTTWNFSRRWLELGPPTTRDRIAVVTAIQWLGSNVGFCFLQEALKACGYKVVKNET